MKAVIDASAAIHAAMRPEDIDGIARLRQSSEFFIAPDIYLAEVGNAIWKYYRFSHLEIEHCRNLLQMVHDLVDILIPVEALYQEAFEITISQKTTMYDSLYLACALSSQGGILTLDTQMQQCAGNLGITLLRLT